MYGSLTLVGGKKTLLLVNNKMSYLAFEWTEEFFRLSGLVGLNERVVAVIKSTGGVDFFLRLTVCISIFLCNRCFFFFFFLFVRKGNC